MTMAGTSQYVRQAAGQPLSRRGGVRIGRMDGWASKISSPPSVA